MAVNIPIIAVSKRVPWIEDLTVEGPDYSGATFKMEIRQKPGDTGTALVTLNNVSPGFEGISCTYDAAYVDPATAETYPASTFLFQIDETTMEALATGTPSDDPVELAYDVHVTPVGGKKFILIYGSFTYYPGVTQ